MAYTTASEVQALIAKFAMGASSMPTITQSEAICVSVSAEIDSRLAAAGYDVPATTPAWFMAFLNTVAQYGAAAAVLKSMFPGATGPAENPAFAFWEKRYQDNLKLIMSGELIVDPLSPTTAVAPSTYFTRNPDEEETLGDIAEPFFTRSKVF